MYEKILNDVRSYEIIFIHGKDCSEYAEDIQECLGYGKLYTYENPKPLIFFGQLSDFVYHTVLLYKGYIIDVTAPRPVYTKQDYDNMMGSTGHTGYTTSNY